MLRVLDLFAGIGGFSLGLERTGGFETGAFCEIDPKARLVLSKHWPDVPIFEDITTLTKERLTSIGPIDVITGGFPCQDISLAGKGAGLEGSRSGLWYEYHRIIEETQPKYAIIENVSALRSRGLDQVLRSLSEIGYDAEWHCIPASVVGAPHRRDRIWIVAYPNSQWGKTLRGECTDTSGESPERGDVGKRGVSNAQRQISFGEAGEDSCAVAYADNHRLQGSAQPEAGQRKRGAILTGGAFARTHSSGHSDGGWWSTEPDVGRVANGVPSRVDRLKQLGNAVVPQIPELIGYAILKHME